MQTVFPENTADLFVDPVLPTPPEEDLSDAALTAVYEDLIEDLALEHLTGRHDGILGAAIDFVRAYRQTEGDCSDEEIAIAGQEEGFTEEEITGALALLHSRASGEDDGDATPLWMDCVK